MIPLRRQLELRAHDLADLLVVDHAGVERVDQDRHRLGDANRVGELHHAALREPGRDDVLGDVARHVAGRAIDLGRIFAGERAAAVRRRAAVGVDDDLAAGDAGIAVRTAGDEAAGRVDQDAACSCPSCSAGMTRLTIFSVMSSRSVSLRDARRCAAWRPRRCRRGPACRRRIRR